MSTAGRERVGAGFYQQLSAAGTEMPHDAIPNMSESSIDRQIFDITGYTFAEVPQSAFILLSRSL